jgi:pyridoxal 5'-phosphate synthase / NAD(P)H-hydrate epimerase
MRRGTNSDSAVPLQCRWPAVPLPHPTCPCDLSEMGLQICYPKPTSKSLYDGLVTQCKSLQLPFLSAESASDANIQATFDVILDALFGFSFRPPLRPPFDRILAATVAAAAADRCFVASVDIPSGWHVEDGDTAGLGLSPDMLISLTAPKVAAKHFKVCACA